MSGRTRKSAPDPLPQVPVAAEEAAVLVEEDATDMQRLHRSEHAQRVTIKTLIERPAVLPKLRDLREEDFTLPLLGRVLQTVREIARAGGAVDFFNVCDAAGFTDTERAKFAVVLDEAYREEDLSAHVAVIRGYAWRQGLAARLDAAKGATLNGVDEATLIEVLMDLTRNRPRHEAEPVDIWGEGVTAAQPKYQVPGLFRERGLHMFWGDPYAGKTWALLRWVCEMLTPEAGGHLSGHPDLAVHERWKRVLWISSEEDAGTLRYMAEMICRGLGVDRPAGDLFHLFAADPRKPITINALPDIVEAGGPLSAVFLDPLVALLPHDGTKWDGDNTAVSAVCLRLRGLANEHDTSIHIVHHTGRDRADYRGPQTWLSSVDVMAGIIAEEGGNAIVVKLQKARGMKALKPFRLTRSWGDGFHITHDSTVVPTEKLKPAEAALDAILRERGRATQKELSDASTYGRSTVQPALKHLCLIGRARMTGTARDRSPEYETIHQKEAENVA